MAFKSGLEADCSSHDCRAAAVPTTIDDLLLTMCGLDMTEAWAIDQHRPTGGLPTPMRGVARRAHCGYQRALDCPKFQIAN